MSRRAVCSLALITLASACADGFIATGEDTMDPRAWVERRAPLQGDSLVLDPTTEHASLHIFDDIIDAKLSHVSSTDGITTWRGQPEGGGEVTLVQIGEHLAGTIRRGDDLIRLIPTAWGTEVEWVDESSMPPDEEPVPVHNTLSDIPPPLGGVRTTTIDVLVAYTTQSRIAAGSKEAMEATIALAVDESNQGWDDSDVPVRIRLVGTREVSGAEERGEWADRLELLRDDGDGFFDEVHPLREELGADEVVLIVEDTTACGVAYVMTDPGPAFESSAFATVSRSCATGHYSFGHEIGHNMGSAHHASFGEQAAFPYAFGHRDDEGAFRTIMAYNCAGGCARVNRWSDPSKVFEGSPLGATVSAEEPADNHEALSDVRDIVADFRPSASAQQPSVQLLAPTGGTLLGGIAELEWDTSDATRVTVGAAPGQADYFDDTVSGGGVTVTGLPVDSSDVWVSLYGDSGRTDTRFSTAPDTEVRLVSPSTTLNRARQEFVWTDDGAPRFRLSIGTEPGAGDVVDIISDDPLVVARRLPTSTLFVQIGSEVEGEWVYTTHTF